jgi:hypothetical protein
MTEEVGTRRAELRKLQRLVCLGITGAIRMATTAATAPSSALAVGGSGQSRDLQLYWSEQRKPKTEGYGHAYVSEHERRTHPTDGD